MGLFSRLVGTESTTGGPERPTVESVGRTAPLVARVMSDRPRPGDAARFDALDDRMIAAVAMSVGLTALAGGLDRIDEREAAHAVDLVSACWLPVEPCEWSQVHVGDVIRLDSVRDDTAPRIITVGHLSRRKGETTSLIDDHGRTWWLEDWTLAGRVVNL